MLRTLAFKYGLLFVEYIVVHVFGLNVYSILLCLNYAMVVFCLNYVLILLVVLDGYI